MASAQPSPVALAWQRFRSQEFLGERIIKAFRERYDGEHEAFARKMAEEASELANNPDDLEECADVLICMLGYLDAANLNWDDLLEVAHTKMSINEQRKWDRREDGTWQHVEGT